VLKGSIAILPGLLARMIGGILISGLFWTWLATLIALRGKLMPALRDG
jgi:hypothetical protein|tara:strand:+ start:109 stop:252 length:144 start_codon:yes stop_codon:yes gene_type:complete